MKPSEDGMVAPKPFKKALAAYERGNLAKTEAHCLAALKSKPEFFDALHLLAIAQSRNGRSIAALANFDKALKLCPAGSRDQSLPPTARPICPHVDCAREALLLLSRPNPPESP